MSPLTGRLFWESDWHLNATLTTVYCWSGLNFLMGGLHLVMWLKILGSLLTFGLLGNLGPVIALTHTHIADMAFFFGEGLIDLVLLHAHIVISINKAMMTLLFGLSSHIKLWNFFDSWDNFRLVINRFKSCIVQLGEIRGSIGLKVHLNVCQLFGLSNNIWQKLNTIFIAIEIPMTHQMIFLTSNFYIVPEFIIFPSMPFLHFRKIYWAIWSKISILWLF